VSIIALLTTLIILFSFEGEMILNDPLLVAYLAAPNLLHYATMITWTYLLGYFSGWAYETAIDTTLIGSSSHFEVAIAVAYRRWGIHATEQL
jgi:ACR3 family arsenite transporter